MRDIDFVVYEVKQNMFVITYHLKSCDLASNETLNGVLEIPLDNLMSCAAKIFKKVGPF